MAIQDAVERLMTQAVSVLAELLSIQTDTAQGGTHTVVEITGWQDGGAVEALAKYLVALRTGIVDQAGRICGDLLGDAYDIGEDLIRSVEEIITQPANSNESPEEWRNKWRNPWIAEGVWHCYMRVAMERYELHTHGVVIAVDFPHVSPKDHGLDVTALYVKEDETLGMSFVETKAYRDDPNGAIGDAVTMLKAIEAGEQDTRLRQMITSFRSIVRDPYSQMLSLSLWKRERTLIPNPHYEETGATVQWTRRRTVFRELKAPVVIMPHCIRKYDAFFETVANEMLRQAREVAANV